MGASTSTDGGTDSAPAVTGAPGSLDTSFGAQGSVRRVGTVLVPGVTVRAASTTAVRVDSQDRIVLTGSDGLYAGAAAWRVTDKGAFDTTFGSAGEWLAPWSGTSHAGSTSSLCLDAQDRPVIGGSTDDAPSHLGERGRMLWRLTSGGQVDPSLNGVGYIYSLLKRTFDTDLRVCARCGGRLVVRAAVTDPASVAKLLAALRRPRAPPAAA